MARTLIGLTLFGAAVALAIYIKTKVAIVGLYFVGYVASLCLMYMAGTLAEKVDWNKIGDRFRELKAEFDSSRQLALQQLQSRGTGARAQAIIPPV